MKKPPISMDSNIGTVLGTGWLPKPSLPTEKVNYIWVKASTNLPLPAY